MTQPQITLLKQENPKPNEFIVQELERYLEEAKSGQIQDFMIITVDHKEMVANSFYGHFRPYSLLGQMIASQIDIARAAGLTRKLDHE